MVSALNVLGGLISVALGARAVREACGQPTQRQPDGDVPGGAGMNASLRGVRNLDERMAIILQLIREAASTPRSSPGRAAF